MTCCASCSPTSIPRSNHYYWRNHAHSLATTFPPAFTPFNICDRFACQPHNTPAFTSSRLPLATTLQSGPGSPCVLPQFSDSISFRQKFFFSFFIGVHYRSGCAPRHGYQNGLSFSLV